MSASTPNVSYEWRRIENLPQDWPALCREDLHAVHQQWLRDQALIKDQYKIRRLQERLATLWAIETGIIERLYHVDRGVTVQILEAGMEALGQFHGRGLTNEARSLIADQRQALEMVMDIVGGSRALNAPYLKELHHRLTFSQQSADARDQFGRPIKITLRKGEWKNTDNSPLKPDGSIHQYCPPEFVQDEIDQLIEWHDQHVAQGVCPEVAAAWLHHRFTQIHPFQDGNGRVARAITSAVFLKADYLVLVIRDEEHRERYLDALETADQGDLRPLVDLFADVQSDDLKQGIVELRELRGDSLIDTVDSIAERAGRRMQESQEAAARVVDALHKITATRLQEVESELDRAFGEAGVIVEAQVDTDDEERRHWWSRQIIDAARTRAYYADLSRPRRWVSLKLGLSGIEPGSTRLVVSFHAVGHSADLHAATIFLTYALPGDNDTEPSRWETETVADKAFTFRTETARMEELEPRFRSWLEDAIQSGISRWGADL